MRADTQDGLEFLEGGIGRFFDAGLESLRVKFPPMSPACFRGQRPRLRRRQIAVDRAPPDRKPAGGFGLSAALVDELDHSLPQSQTLGFHAREPIRLCANVNMNYEALAKPVGGDFLRIV